MALQTVVETGRQARDRIRSNQWRGVTSGVAPGYVQANLAILPKDLAFDFLCSASEIPSPVRSWRSSSPATSSRR